MDNRSCLAEIQDEFTFHKHNDEDESFTVIKWRLKLELKDRTVMVNPRGFYIVPKGLIQTYC